MNWSKGLGGAALLALTVVFLAACGTFEMKFESTPVPAESGRSTAALVLSPVSTPTLTPDPMPQLTAMPTISITSFTISPLRVQYGDSVTLTWTTIGAKSATLNRFAFDGKIESTSVPKNGSLHYDMTTASDYSYRFLLLADDGYGFSDVQAWVQPEVICPTAWFFSDPPDRCPTAAQYSPMITQRFQHGLMIWAQSVGASENGMVYLIYNDHGMPAWDTVSYTWSEGMPENDPSLIPPSGFYQPVRGLGQIWRKSSASEGKRVCDRLGWALEPASVVQNAALQCEEGPNSTCFISGPADQIYALLPESMPWWLVWSVPTLTPTP